jgi:hypothetical protein
MSRLHLSRIAVLAVLALAAGVPAATAAAAPVGRSHPHESPLSGSVLVARAVHSGSVRASGSAGAAGPQTLSCSPAPCALPNVQASQGKKPVNEDPIAANPANSQDLLTGGNDYNCGSLLGFFASGNGGSTFNRNCMNTLAANPFGCGDPGVGYDVTGAAYITGILSSNSSCVPGVVAFEKSTDNGAKWSAPAVAVTPLFSGGIADKPWLQVDDNASSPHANALYISVTQFDSTGNDSRISVSHSSDGGSTWSRATVDPVQKFPSVDQFSDLAIGKDGTVYVSWMRCTASGGSCGGTQATLLVSKSTDEGATWSQPATIATVTLAPDPGHCCFYGALPNTSERVSAGAVLGIDNSSGPRAGNLYAAFYTWTGSFMVLQVATSTDGGASWSAPVRVTPCGDPGDEFFPWLSVSSGGLVGVSWLDRRDDPFNVSYEAFAAVSSDGGASFPNLQIASAASSPKNDGFNGTFMGDYTGSVWNAAGAALYASWMDSRNGTNMQDEVGGRIGAGTAPAWNIICSPNVGTQSQVDGVTAVSANDVWAVGFSTPSSVQQTLAEHWNGTSWNVIPSPDVGTAANQLNGAAAAAANDVWAAGSSTAPGGVSQTLIEHWNGTSWTVVPSPNVGTLGNSFNAVAVVSATDAWAVGSTSGAGQTLIEHWNGTSWSVVSSPNVGTLGNSFNAVAVVAANDIWAVGSSTTACSGGCVQQTLIEHWDGTSWSVVPSPNVDPSLNVLNGIAVVAGNNVWAVGSSGGTSNPGQTLIEHWNGSSWTVVSSPNVGTSTNVLGAVAVVAANDIWAVGFSTSSFFQPLTEHWDGTRWQVVKSLDIGTQGNVLAAAAAITTTDVWAAGTQDTSTAGSSRVPLIEHYCC